jgi:hypothetical protein
VHSDYISHRKRGTGTSEGFALDLRVELVAPAEAAGLAGAAGDPLRNEGPVPGPVSHDQIG